LFSYQNINGDYTEEWRLFSFEIAVKWTFYANERIIVLFMVCCLLFVVCGLWLELFFIWGYWMMEGKY
jgi:hypothetical protein